MIGAYVPGVPDYALDPHIVLPLVLPQPLADRLRTVLE
jgi:hypothetical protein